jgi:L-threonylcarbamoyladenylate synthase
MVTQNPDAAIAELKAGRPIGLPTETVYGLAADITNDAALRSIFHLKNRPFFDPLIVHVPTATAARDLVADWPREAEVLAHAFWPGPLTLILPKSPKINGLITSGLDTVGVRCPRHDLALSVLKQVGPLAAPSANQFGRTSPSTAQHVASEFPPSLLILDGGPCEVGIESTVFDVATCTVLRPGFVTVKELSHTLGRQVTIGESHKSPGHLEHHYQPRAPLVIVHPLNETEPDEALLRRAQQNPAARGRITRVVHLPTDPRLAARELYQRLRESDAPEAIIVVPWRAKPAGVQADANDEIWTAIWDRLKRAATAVIADKSANF